MKFEFFKHKEASTVEKGPIEQPKEEPQKIGGLNKSVIAATIGAFSILPNISKAEVVNKDVDGNKNNPVVKHAEAPLDVNKKADNFSMTDRESNEKKEQQFNLEFAKESQEHVGKGGYVSEKVPRCVLIAENGEPSHGGSFSSENAIQVKVYKASADKMDGYKIMNVYFDGKSLNENSHINVESRINKTDPIGLSFTYGILREKMNPQEIQKLLEKANPGLNVDMLIAALESNTSYDLNEKNQMRADILTLRQSPSKTINDNKLNEQRLADAGK